MTIFSSIERAVSEFQAARSRYLTERAISSLPFELQKDIGWPEAADERPKVARGVGSWAGAK